MVVDLNSNLTLFVIKFELLNKREFLSRIEELSVFFGLFGFASLQILESVVDIHRVVVVIVHREALHVEVRSHHGTVQRGTSGDTLERVERALELLLLEDLLNNSLNNRCPSAVTNKLNKLNLIGR